MLFASKNHTKLDPSMYDQLRALKKIKKINIHVFEEWDLGGELLGPDPPTDPASGHVFFVMPHDDCKNIVEKLNFEIQAGIFVLLRDSKIRGYDISEAILWKTKHKSMFICDARITSRHVDHETPILWIHGPNKKYFKHYAGSPHTIVNRESCDLLIYHTTEESRTVNKLFKTQLLRCGYLNVSPDLI